MWLALALTASPLAAAQRALAPEDVVSLWRVSDPQISPDGSRVALVLSAPDASGSPRARLWLAQAEGAAPRELETPGPAVAPRWFPDGRAIAFIAPGPGSSQIGRLVVDGGVIDILATVEGAVRDARLSPDGATIAFLKTDPETRADAERKKRGDDAMVIGEGHAHTRLYGLDLRTRAVRPLAVADETIWRFSWSPDGKRIAYLASALPTAEGQEYRSALFVLDVASGRVSRVTTETNPHAAPAFSPDGRSLVYLGPVGKFKERGVVQVMPAEGGSAVARLADQPLNAWDVKWLPSGGLLAGIQRGTRHALAALTGDDPPRDLATLDFTLTPYWDACFTVSADGRRAAFLSEGADHLEEVFLADLDGSGSRRRLTRFSDRLAGVSLGRVEAVRWTNPADGSPLEGVLVRPPGDAAGRARPLVTWLHGGPAYGWGLGAHLRTWAQLLAGQGYLVFLPSFRGSAGYGMAFMTANVRDWGPGPLSDVLSGVDHLIQKGEADPRRLFVGGGSYGGYLTAWTVTHSDRFRAAFVLSGVSSLASEYALTDEPSFLTGYFAATPYDDAEVYTRLSPAAQAAAARTPTLIAHGERDLRVPVTQAHELYAALRHHGAPSRLVLYPREGHSIREPAHQIDLMKRVLEWFRDHDAR
jgi:dipeptidyl aminopeptidase/acylaminoacyl peptidase